MSQSERFTVLRATDRVWAIGAIHGDSNKLMALHDTIAEDIRFGDRVVYLGNYWGYGTDGPGVLEELLRFRNWFLSFDPFRHVDDLVYLRGAQEEMWWKLMQLQFAPNPAEVLTWMLQRGMGSMMQALGFNPEEGALQAKEGTLALTYWTNRLRQAARPIRMMGRCCLSMRGWISTSPWPDRRIPSGGRPAALLKLIDPIEDSSASCGVMIPMPAALLRGSIQSLSTAGPGAAAVLPLFVWR